MTFVQSLGKKTFYEFMHQQNDISSAFLLYLGSCSDSPSQEGGKTFGPSWEKSYADVETYRIYERERL